jgi:Meckel syndrome type 1 protein
MLLFRHTGTLFLEISFQTFADEIPQMPKIYFEISSYDSWSRYRTEGYTWTQLSSKPGNH